ACGAPKAMRGSVTDGIVSAVRSGDEVRELLKRTAGSDVYTERLGYDLDAEWIQTSAPISGGNSGGPLVNDKGEVVGITTWGRTDGQNLNFAVSVQHVKAMLETSEKIPKPLGSLPEMKRSISTVAAGDAKKTLDYWTQRTKIQSDLYLKITRPKSWKSPRDALNFSDAAAGASKLYVADVSKLEITDVDEQLVDAVLDHVNLIRKLGDAWMVHAEAIRSGDERAARNSSSNIDHIDRQASELMHTRFTDLRQLLSKRYATPFPHYEPDVSSTSP